MPTVRIKKTLLNLTTRAEVERIVGEIREQKIREQKILAAKNAAVSSIDERFAPELEAAQAEIDQRVTAVQAWAEAHPEEFAKRKSIEFTHGTVGFRIGTPKLALLSRAWTWEKCLLQVRTLLPAFIRDTPSIDKEAILAQRDEEIVQFAIRGCGLKVTQDEKFFVEPVLDEVETRETCEVGQ